MKAKLTCTMYFDYWSSCWDWDKPDGKMGDDYSILRKGSVFTVYSTTEEIKQISSDFEISEQYGVICADKKGNWFGYKDWTALKEAEHWEIVDND